MTPAPAATGGAEEDGGAGSGAAPESEAGGEDAGAPVGPTESEEAAFLAEQRAAAPAYAPLTNEAGELAAEEPAGSLPPLEDLVRRIPAPTRALIDELFRARFVTVKRVPTSALK